VTNRPDTATNLARERKEQRRWRLRPPYAKVTAFNQLVDGEFLSVDQQIYRQSQALSRIVEFAATAVPYYRDLFAERGLTAQDIQSLDDLTKLPLLGKESVRANHDRLRPARLPRGERIHGVFLSSGTTGQPVKILHTASSNAMFTYLGQRQHRWFRFDPMATLATIRLASQLPRPRGPAPNPDGITLRMARWRYSGKFFETGKAVGFNITNPVEEQLEWLRAERPKYLASYSESLEHLCFASGQARPVDSIAGVHAISEQLTPDMRRRVENTFAAPAHQNYGLNEIGLTAVRCGAGRYHVHIEHCLIEIVDAEGQVCKPGQRGRIAVTALRNPAMPLIRYDTDDMATAVEGPCPCGRSLPSFGDIAGRYSRIAYLPDGTLGLVASVRDALEKMPPDLALNLRRFQVHQNRKGGFALRLATAGPLPETFHDRIRSAWQSTTGPQGATLDITEVGDIPRDPSGKFQDFTSDYMPAPDREAPNAD